MATEKDFEKYGLESLLTLTKHQIDTKDPEYASVVDSAAHTLQAILRHSVLEKFDVKYRIHGLQDHVVESFKPQFEKVSIPVDLMKKQDSGLLVKRSLDDTLSKIKAFNSLVTESKYLKSLSEKLAPLAHDVEDIFADEKTSYQAADVKKFQATKVWGYKADAFALKLKGIQILLGGLNTFNRRRFESESIRNSMEWHLVQAGFSFDNQIVVAPKDNDTVVYDTLGNLGWNPQLVDSLNDTLESVINTEKEMTVLSDILADSSKIDDVRKTATLVENTYNVRNIMSYVKNTLCVMCRQYLQMVRNYK